MFHLVQFMRLFFISEKNQQKYVISLSKSKIENKHTYTVCNIICNNGQKITCFSTSPPHFSVRFFLCNFSFRWVCDDERELKDLEIDD